MSSLGNAFARALALQQAGDFGQAERLYEQILRNDPQNPEAWHMLGLAVFRAGRREQAVDCLSRAVSLDHRSPLFLGDLGAVCHQVGRLDEAIDCFQQALELAPEQPRLHYNLGAALQTRGDQVGAKFRLLQAVRLQPAFPEAWNDLGIARQALGEMEEAATCFERVIALAPGIADGYFNLGNVRLAQERLLEALASYAQAVERQPGFVKALNNLGTVLHRLGRLDQACQAYEAALKLRPDFADARNNLGAVLSLLGRHAQAETWYRDALVLDPRSVTAHYNLAGALLAQLRLDEAERFLRQTLALDRKFTLGMGHLANVLAMQGRVSEAEEYFREALEQEPNPRLQVQAAIALPPIYESTGQLQQARAAITASISQLHVDGVSLDPRREVVPVNFLLAYQGLNDRELASRVAGLFRSGEEPPAVPAPHFATRHAATGDRRTPRTAAGSAAAARPKIRIGFLSKFLRDHTIGDLTKGLIRELSRDDFAVTVFLVGEAADETVTFLRRCAQQFVPLIEDVAAARKAVVDADLDILVFPDVGMDPLSYTLAFSRLAPVQCAMWGHPVTTGIPTIDHFISSRLIEPDNAGGHYSENLVLLDSLPTYYYRPRLANPAAGHSPDGTIASDEREAARRAFGLPQDAHLYACPQSLFKFHPDFDPVLAAILTRDPGARLLLIEAPHRNWTQMLSRRLEKNLRGLCDRVSFVPRVDRPSFLRLLAASDLLLDPLHFGGGNTSFQALGLGVPIVTLPGPFMRGRVTAGCYRKMGFETCIAESTEGYIDLALRLGTDQVFNAQVRSEIHARSAGLFEDHGAVRELEEFFRATCHRSSECHSPRNGVEIG